MKSGFIAIVGEPNAGKSTLLNRWVGEHLAIVTPKAQTTRQAIRGIVNHSGVQAVFIDTPGFHESARAFNRYMIAKVKESIRDADVCCLVTEPTEELSALNQELLAYAKERHKPVVIAINKMDTVTNTFSLPTHIRTSAHPQCFLISALSGLGCNELLKAVIEELSEGPPLYPDDIYTEHSARFLVSELIREVLLEKLHQELPYAAAVVIDEYKEKPAITVITATIVVEKDSQKAMVIGARGGMVKEIGVEARARIEKMIGTRVFLELLVRVEKNWTKDAKKVEELGYT